MKKEIHYCDRCGKESEFIRTFMSNAVLIEDFELCRKCLRSFKKWYKNIDEEKE